MRSIPKIKRARTVELCWIYLFLLPSVAIFVMFYLIPIIQVLFTSLTTWDGFNPPKFNGIDNYIRVFQNAQFLLSLKNLLWWSVIAMTLHVGYGVLLAFILFRKPFGWRLTQTVFMVPNVISVAAWAMIYKFFFKSDIGILNSIIRIFIPGYNVEWFFEAPYAFWAVTLTWLFYSVIVTLLVQGDLMAIPEQLREAARIDGASRWQIIWRVELPLCRNSIGTGVICSITARIAMYESVYLTTNGAGDTTSTPLLLVRAIQDNKFGTANTYGVVMIALGLLTLFVVNRLFRMNDSVY